MDTWRKKDKNPYIKDVNALIRKFAKFKSPPFLNARLTAKQIPTVQRGLDAYVVTDCEDKSVVVLLEFPQMVLLLKFMCKILDTYGLEF